MQPVDRLFPGLSGLRVIVTGGTRGIGAGIAQGFLRTGAQVMVCARNEPASPLAADGRTASFTRADVRDPEQTRPRPACTTWLPAWPSSGHPRSG